ncbi:transglycosylase domain-containing protein [Laspinema olomoucense]|uniref:transglycosylase domain-containing protein n=1 Tax=Laspinema olomoucense TaxID=3231600 RepID=UPI0021BAF347|nr:MULTISPECIES: penicillin-binding protein 1A [unclassified Laspinema]MCT7991450.1 penicillin-binding protein 1A [Laspinema sp. D3a]MCT7996614.1 penicillin-binding protein 1A [Laspinema sp. D3c]
MAKFISKLKNISRKFGGATGSNSRKPGDLRQQNQGDRPEVDLAHPTVLPGTPLSLAPGEPGQPREPQAIAPQENPSDPGKPSKAGKPGKNILSSLKRLWFNPGGKPVYRRRIFWVGLGVVVVSSTAGTLTWVWWRIDRSLPDVSEVFTFVRDGTLTITTKDGTILQQIGPATRDKLKMQDIPPPLVEAFIASEDSRFYQHRGLDYQGVLRATVANILAREVVEGGSTITQQLARMVFLTQEQTAGRKIREAFLARKIEKNMRKQQILERYLNYVYLGSGAYGIADAAWVYFSKSVNELTLSEMAMIAGLPPAPSAYSPLVNLENARVRRNIVLQRMTELGYITAEAAAEAREQPLQVQASAPKRLKVEAPYFTSYIQKELPKLVSKEALEMGGLTVETTIDLKWQKMAEQVVKEAAELDGPAQGFEQAALVAIAPDTGEIKVMVGGRSFQESEFNRVTQAQRQPGSTFKGFVYAAAIAAGWSPYDGYEDANFKVDGYKPRNFGGKYRGWVSISDALTNSINVVAVKVLIDIGFEPTIELAKNMGIKSKLDPIYSLALGGSEVNLLELTSAYGTIAAEGKYHEPHGITRIIDRRGDTIYQGKSQPKQALDKETSAIVTWMLEPVVQQGTGAAAQLDNRPVAGKTGTSDEARDLWFIGYIPQLVTGVWLGNDDSYPTWGSSSTAAFTWRQFMEKAVEGMPVEEFPEIPERLDGRKEFIKTKPVTPNSIFYGDTTPDNAQTGSANAGDYSEGYY